MKELKNLERTDFNWFGVKELKHMDTLDEQQIKETMKFSFAPFVPYWVYSFIRSNWDFLLLRYLSIVVFYIVYFVFYFSFIFDTLLKSSKHLSDSEFPKEMVGKGLILIGVALVLFLVLLFAAELCECFVARRLSWNRLSWKDFESFQYSENQWNIIGLVFLAIRVLAILGFIALITVLFFGAKEIMPGLLDQLINI